MTEHTPIFMICSIVLFSQFLIEPLDSLFAVEKGFNIVDLKFVCVLQWVIIDFRTYSSIF